MFARKILRLFGHVTEEDIANEARVISEVCQGQSIHVIQVLNHGWLRGSYSYYFIDMEYCPETLADYIQRARGRIATGSNPGRFPPSEIWPLRIAPTPEPAFSVPGTVGDPSDVVDILWNPIRNILNDIVSGLIYIHRNQVVHRDLKPRNGFCH